jgi:hypothetical protein
VVSFHGTLDGTLGKHRQLAERGRGDVMEREAFNFSQGAACAP